MHNYRELKIWHKAIELSVEIYELVADFPSDEKFGIVSQLRRASVSVPSNIAEGSSRKSQKEFAHYLSMSLGSLFEIETQLTISNRIRYIDNKNLEEFKIKITDLVKMIMAFKNHIK
jgi:four helix bundle protein